MLAPPGLAPRSPATYSFASEKCRTDQKNTEQILQHYKSRSVFNLRYFRKTFSTPFCIELTITSTCSIIKSKSSMSWLTEPFDFFTFHISCLYNGEPIKTIYWILTIISLLQRVLTSASHFVWSKDYYTIGFLDLVLVPARYIRWDIQCVPHIYTGLNQLCRTQNSTQAVDHMATLVTTSTVQDKNTLFACNVKENNNYLKHLTVNYSWTSTWKDYVSNLWVTLWKHKRQTICMNGNHWSRTS